MMIQVDPARDMFLVKGGVKPGHCGGVKVVQSFGVR